MYNTHSINGRSRAVAGVYGVLPVDPVCLICVYYLFICAIYTNLSLRFVSVQVQKINNQM